MALYKSMADLAHGKECFEKKKNSTQSAAVEFYQGDF